MNRIIIFFAIAHIFLIDIANAKKISNSKIKMLNGEYAKLYDFNNEGPAIINFWTTW